MFLTFQCANSVSNDSLPIYKNIKSNIYIIFYIFIYVESSCNTPCVNFHKVEPIKREITYTNQSGTEKTARLIIRDEERLELAK